jgi:ABC-type Fe3+ transport system substrate-binding protein
MLPHDQRPPLPESFAQMNTADVYALFRKRGAASAMLTTGQIAALEGALTNGQGFPFRVIVPEEIITDQVWYAGLTADAPAEAAELLAFLTGHEAQKALCSQDLHTVRDDLLLYAAGTPAQAEQAGRRALSAINAFWPPDLVASAAWQAFQGTIGFSEALTPLL